MCGRAGDTLVLYLGHVVYIYCRSKMPFDGKEMLQSNTFGSPTVYGLLNDSTGCWVKLLDDCLKYYIDWSKCRIEAVDWIFWIERNMSKSVFMK